MLESSSTLVRASEASRAEPRGYAPARERDFPVGVHGTRPEHPVSGTERPQLLGAVSGLLSAVLFGASVPITKRLLPEVPPVLLAGLLYLGGGLAVGSVRLAARHR